MFRLANLQAARPQPVSDWSSRAALTGRRAWVGAALGMMLLAGCSGALNDAVEQDVASVTQSREQGEADRNGDRFTFRDAAPETNNQHASTPGLPAGYPDDFYRPEDFRVIGVMDRGDLRMARLRTAGSPRTLGDDARRAMVQRGWRLAMSHQHGNQNRVLAFTKGRRTAVLVFDDAGTQDNGEAQVDLQWRPGRQ